MRFHGANGAAGTSGCDLAARLRAGSGTPRANMTYPHGIIGITCLGLIHDYLRLRPTAQAAGYKFTPRGHQDHRITVELYECHRDSTERASAAG